MSALGPRIAKWMCTREDYLNVCQHSGKTLRQGSFVTADKICIGVEAC